MDYKFKIQTMTKIDEIANLLKGISETPRLDSQFFCEVYPNPTLERIDDFIHRRKQGEPVSKIVGQKGFWKRDFYVNADVLDPRPDSETLIEAVLKTFPDTTVDYHILDIGTGSGCLLLTLLDEYPNAQGTGIDISEKALAVAQKNNTTNRADFLQKDMFSDDFTAGLVQYDIIISNPPYIPTKDIETLDNAVKLYDPLTALDGGVDGLNPYRRLSACLAAILKPNGRVFFEIGQGQENDVISIMAQNLWVLGDMYMDLGGIVRVLSFCKSTNK